MSRKRRRGLRENAGKLEKPRGEFSLRIVVRVFLVVRVVRVVCGGRAGITRPRVIVVLFLAYELVALARCACGLWRRENLSRVFTTDNDALVRRVDLRRVRFQPRSSASRV